MFDFDSRPNEAILGDQGLNEDQFREYIQSRRVLKLAMVEVLLLIVFFLAWVAREASPVAWGVMGLCLLTGVGALLIERRASRQDDAEWTRVGLPTRPISPISSRVLALGMLTFALWAATAVLGLWAIADLATEVWPGVFRALAGPAASQFQEDGQLLASTYAVLMVLGLVWLAVVIGGGEYHRRRLGRPSSYKLFGLTLAVEGVVLAVAQLV
jgi:hypothetical protein